MTQAPRMEFWFEFASTYSYPAAMRAPALCAEAGVTLVWRPFLLGPVFAHYGMQDSPFNLNPVKGAYMWQDMARLCAAQGLPLRKPSVFPRGSLLGARLITAFPDAPWTSQVVQALYHANFAEDADIGQDAAVRDLLTDAGLDPDPLLQAATAPETKARLRAATEEAIDRGLFGAPSMTVGGALYWGNDRLEAAIADAAQVNR